MIKIVFNSNQCVYGLHVIPFSNIILLVTDSGVGNLGCLTMGVVYRLPGYLTLY